MSGPAKEQVLTGWLIKVALEDTEKIGVDILQV